MTPAEELRHAAKRIRSDAAWPSEELSVALAALLDELAEHADHGSQGALVQDGIVVARAYLGSMSREATP